MGKKILGVVFALFFLSLPMMAWAAPPLPARIGGTVTVDGTQLTQATATGYTFVVTKLDGTAYVPAAEDTDGLNASDWYIIDIPIYDPNDQPGGANPGDTAVIHVYKDAAELGQGHLKVGASGSTTQMDLGVNTKPVDIYVDAAGECGWKTHCYTPPYKAPWIGPTPGLPSRCLQGPIMRIFLWIRPKIWPFWEDGMRPLQPSLRSQ